MARDTTVTTEWNGKELMIRAMRKMETNAERVGMMLDGEVVKLLSKGQPVKRVGKGRAARLVGLQPSRPGEPPRLLHGLLRNSINHRTEIKRGSVTVYVGANTKYARALEYGNPKATKRAHDSAIKNVTSLASGMRTAGAGKARPYLRPTLAKNKEKALKRLVKGVFPKRGAAK